MIFGGIYEPLIYNINLHHIRPQNIDFVPWMDDFHIINY